MATPVTDSKAGMRLATFVICAVLLLQAAAVGGRVDSAGFPFVDYPMYSSVRYEGDRMDDRTVFVTLDDGRRELVTLADVNLDLYQYAKWTSAIVRHPKPPWQEDGWRITHRIKSAVGLRRPDIDLVRAFVERYEQRRGANVVRLEVEDGMAIVTRHGMEMATEPRVMRDLAYPTNVRARP